MLAQFLETHRQEILKLTQAKTEKLAGSLSSSAELESSLPFFFEHLIEFLKATQQGPVEEQIVTDASEHGRELLRLNYTLSHVVHAYGAMCQAITELSVKAGLKISAQDFNHLNLCLDGFSRNS